MMNPRAYTGGQFCLELDGVQVGFPKAVRGGMPRARVAVHNLGGHQEQKKHISKVAYQDLELELPLGMGKGLHEWIEAALDARRVVKDGAILACNNEYKVMRRLDFFGAHITSVTMPSVDASSKEAVYLKIKLALETSRMTTGGGEPIREPDAFAPKRWLASAFDIDISGLDCSDINQVGEITFSLINVDNAMGRFRDPEIKRPSIEYSDVAVTVSADSIDDWLDYFNDFVVAGNCDDANEKSATLTYYKADQKSILATVNLFNMGPISIDPTEPEARPTTYEATFYTQEASLKLDGASTI